MSRRMFLVGCCLVLSATALHSQTNVGPAPAKSLPFRTSSGAPDLQGVWNWAGGTPLERPAELADKPELTDAELADAERAVHKRANVDRRDGARTDADVDREFNEFWHTRRPTILSRRTSLITDPPNGRLPPLTPEAEQRRTARIAAQRSRGSADSYEDRRLSERCIMIEANGPPILPSGTFEILLGREFPFQIVQAPTYVAILSEEVQQLRIIPLDGGPHISTIRQWLGDSRGHWEGQTLVIETTNFDPRRSVAGFPAENMRVVERVTRSGAETIDYQFTVYDPTTWVSPWTAAVPIAKTNGEIYEFACHEGNYGLMNILTGARVQDKRR
jgi:hypothetical protein